MKTFTALTVSLVLLSGMAQAADKDCTFKARNAAYKAALLERDSQQAHLIEIDPRTVENRFGRSVSVFDVYLDMCEKDDHGACGSMSYEVVTVGESPACKVVRVTLTGEE